MMANDDTSSIPAMIHPNEPITTSVDTSDRSELDKILDKLLSFSPALSARQRADGTVRHLTGSQVRSEAREELLAWRDRTVAEKVKEAKLRGYKNALYDVGYGYEPITKLDSVEESLAKFQSQETEI